MGSGEIDVIKSSHFVQQARQAVHSIELLLLPVTGLEWNEFTVGPDLRLEDASVVTLNEGRDGIHKEEGSVCRRLRLSFYAVSVIRPTEVTRLCRHSPRVIQRRGIMTRADVCKAR